MLVAINDCTNAKEENLFWRQEGGRNEFTVFLSHGNS